MTVHRMLDSLSSGTMAMLIWVSPALIHRFDL